MSKRDKSPPPKPPVQPLDPDVIAMLLEHTADRLRTGEPDDGAYAALNGVATQTGAAKVVRQGSRAWWRHIGPKRQL